MAFDASWQIGKVQVVFVHKVLQHHVEEPCGNPPHWSKLSFIPVCDILYMNSMLLTKRYNNGTYNAVSHNHSEHTKGPSIHGSILKLICLVLQREEKCVTEILSF